MPPAARVTDLHVCPATNGPVPHVGGPILPAGEPTVLIGFMPAARQGDPAFCAGPPDSILQGEPSVLIGNMPAARLGDPTAHGGTVALGCPTVWIGSTTQSVALSSAGGVPFCEECAAAQGQAGGSS
jgi:uncharacterized Zn-binding protein involved in type VI secretion